MTYQDQTPLLPIYGGRIDCYAISCFRHCKEENRIFSPNPYKITLSGFYFPAVATRWRWSGEFCYGGHYRPLSEAKSGRRAHQEGQFPGLRARERIVSQWGRPSISFCGPLGNEVLKGSRRNNFTGEGPIISSWGWVFAPRFGSDSAATIEQDRRHSTAMSRISRMRRG